MTSTGNNFYKNGNKIKLPNMYAYESYKSSSLIDCSKGKNSISPNRIFSVKENNRNSKTNPFLPMMNSYNNHPFKLMDNVKFKRNIFKKF